MSRRKPNFKNRVVPEVEAAVEALALEQPAWGQLRAANELAQRGIPISAAGVRCVWKRQGLENLNKRLRALEAKVARESPLLTEVQLAALEKAKVEKEAPGEFESEGPGYCGAQDTFDVETVKSGGLGHLLFGGPRNVGDADAISLFFARVGPTRFR